MKCIQNDYFNGRRLASERISGYLYKVRARLIKYTTAVALRNIHQSLIAIVLGM